MLEKELENLNRLKGEYEIAKKATESLQNFAYDNNHIKFDDGYYDAIIKFTDCEVSFHLPTVIPVMEKYTRELSKRYHTMLDKYEEINKEENNV